MVLERPRTIPEGPGSAPEGSGMSRNDPDRSRKVLEASGRFQKFPGSTTHYPTPLSLGASHLGCPSRLGGGEGAMRGGGEGAAHIKPQGLCATLPPSKPRCSTIRPRFRR